ncbi:MAG: ligase-associated DNA damage response endonuclease PdeM [Phenylobacterium sp.]|uniref:ligase-associated DNA damage response endonuclease PdeM n=1 Tax=Phenylobacterium sp. TaxID=1871053 RepID=UPI00272262F9|nr:ligase-associated DNA damage response endonuclease PdeM [Phenylobacterium sp.]MDO8410094.1 ligase-associated DNA damage response endonuclease PdeM [Phenylobacterium sp.]
MVSSAQRVSNHATSFSASPCGGLAIAINGEMTVLRASGAMWLPDHAALIVADLHFEKGSAYGMRGQFLPPYDTRDTLDRLEAEVAALEPRVVIFLGDSFHDGRAEDRLSPDDAARLVALAQGRTLIWLVGNHDADGPRRLPGQVIDTMALGGLVLRHEPEPGEQPGELSGHLHPCARVSSGRGTVRRRCFATDGARMILPAFGAYAGGLNLKDAAFAGLFARPPLAGALGRDRVHAVGWRSLTGD